MADISTPLLERSRLRAYAGLNAGAVYFRPIGYNLAALPCYDNAMTHDDLPIFSLFNALWQDFHHPGAYAVLAALGLAVYLARLTAAKLTGGLPRRAPLFCPMALYFPALAAVFVYFLGTLLSASGLPYLALLDLATALAVSWAGTVTAVMLLRRVFSKNTLLVYFERWISLSVWGLCLLHITGILSPTIGLLEQTAIPIGAARHINLWQLIKGVVTLCLTLLFSTMVSRLIEEKLAGIERLDESARALLIRFEKSLLLAVATLFGLSLVGIDLTMLSVFGSAFLVGLGFGLQKIASSYVSGFIILLDRSIRVGNIVSIDPLTTGTVKEITMRYTVLRLSSGADLLIPNENLVTNSVRNFTFSDTKIRLAIPIQVACDANVQQAMSLMADAARGVARVLADPAPLAALTGFSDKGVNLELGFWINAAPEEADQLRSDVALAILGLFSKNAIKRP